MVVHTQTERVHKAQNAVVEFLLINHPLDCPVCDKGGECPLQDITYGWGAGTSRFIEPKRHFRKPLELSPLIAIDRERCILCYRCVRFSQEVSEDYQLILLERGAHSFVGTFDGHPYVAPFSGNIIELCPVGALTSSAYRFRARPWDIEGAGHGLHAVPGAVQRRADDPRRQASCACSRATTRASTTAGCATRAASPTSTRRPTSASSSRWCARAPSCSPRRGRRRWPPPAARWPRPARGPGRWRAARPPTRRRFLLARLLRDGLGSSALSSAPAGSDALALDVRRALSDPALAAEVEDLEFAHAVLLLDCDPIDDAPMLDLRIRKGIRRRGRAGRRGERPADRAGPERAGGAALRARRGRRAAGLARRGADRRRGQPRRRGDRGGHQRPVGPRLRRLPDRRRRGRRDRLRRAAAARAARRRRRARAAEPREPPRPARPRRRRPARAAGVRQRARPARGGLRARPRRRATRRSRRRWPAGPPRSPTASEAGELSVVYLLQSDPLRVDPDRDRWARALGRRRP